VSSVHSGLPYLPEVPQNHRQNNLKGDNASANQIEFDLPFCLLVLPLLNSNDFGINKWHFGSFFLTPPFKFLFSLFAIFHFLVDLVSCI
jgi:hypothetical protein